MLYQVAVHGGYNPEYYHFLDEQALVRWLLGKQEILEVTVREV